jgi:sensor domain CHASE-containing protein
VDAKVDNHECERVHNNLDTQLDDIKKRVFT